MPEAQWKGLFITITMSVSTVPFNISHPKINWKAGGNKFWLNEMVNWKLLVKIEKSAVEAMLVESK
jgi:hypothetical protein